ncbi:hypothetical protein D3C85_1343940 [compost metagenome]
MIRNDHIHPKLTRRVSNLVIRTDSGINSDNKRYSLLLRPIQSMIMQSIAFICAVWNINIKRSAQVAQQIDHQRSTGHSVRIIVAIYQNMFFLLQGLSDSGNRFGHPFKQEGIMPFPVSALHEHKCLVRRVHASFDKQRRQERRNRKAPGQIPDFIRIGCRRLPSCF